ncbi:MAG TPA: metalloregulator ArsR/SmtB family transcription factor [Pedococcus sp.]|nr:metalloregulator ArsR/SmtB family transcription factor [Pedococcus sp.]
MTTDAGETACCGSLATDDAMSREQAEATAQLLKAVADPVRLRLLSLIRTSKDHEACVCDLTPAVGLSQPTVSHHLKVLTEAGLVSRERRGTWAWFRLVPGRLDDLAAIFR